jgi:hypothetical protein
MRLHSHVLQNTFVLARVIPLLIVACPRQTCASCPPGYTGPSVEQCIACAAGKYKDSTGTDSCTDCRLNSISPPASTSSAACLCDIGRFLIADGCYGCSAGYYKDVIGNQACSRCPPNTYPKVITITPPDYWPPRTSSSCLSCPSGNICLSGCGDIRYCRCDVGHYGERESVCLPCDAGIYAPTVDHQQCQYCTPGYYQDQIGATSCKQCPPGTSSDYGDWSGAVTCDGCPENAGFDTANNSCACKAGYTSFA